MILWPALSEMVSFAVSAACVIIVFLESRIVMISTAQL